jgi:hypothetical protein
MQKVEDAIEECFWACHCAEQVFRKGPSQSAVPLNPTYPPLYPEDATE